MLIRRASCRTGNLTDTDHRQSGEKCRAAELSCMPTASVSGYEGGYMTKHADVGEDTAEAYNKEHGITPQTIKKSVRECNRGDQSLPEDDERYEGKVLLN